MTIRVLFLLLFALPYLYAQPFNSWEHEKIEVHNRESINTILDAESIFEERWDVLPQPQFWMQIMRLAPDSCLINVASTRQVLVKMSLRDWHNQTETEKSAFRDSLRSLHGLVAGERINVTTGKNDFYRFKDVYPTLSKGVEVFEKNGVDPWYAQAILLIESPGQLAKSISGAYGAFQLMPSVARAQGLTVNEKVDERKNFERSAYAASRLIKRICIPEAKKILEAHQLKVDENDLWFRLFVLHVYHAGAGNVAAVVNKIGPVQGDKELITKMWQTSAGGFGNNSQNYTQLALAAQLILHNMIYEHCDQIFDCASFN
ncbi:MAG: transglycosylase SLT domain-containing protein [Cryomorphaceae bacterium]|nr:transglycosylase SLT domain-containing protein [Cryomorphaceae bacterium]